MFRRRIFPGAVTGGVVGLASGTLMIPVLTGSGHHIGRPGELHHDERGRKRTLLGAAFGGACTIIAGNLRMWLQRS